MDYYNKLFKYRTAGVREYWIVDPDKNRVVVYNFESEDISDYTFDDSVKAEIYEDLSIDFSQLDF
jgi:Uma2 family endonuclease